MSVFSDIAVRSNADTDLVEASWWNVIRTALVSVFPGGGIIVTGSAGTPEAITAGGGVTSNGGDLEIQFIEGSGGAVTVTADPQISDGTSVGQLLKLIGKNDTNTVTLSHGTGLVLNGNCTLGLNSILQLIWDGTSWIEDTRNF